MTNYQNSLITYATFTAILGMTAALPTAAQQIEPPQQAVTPEVPTQVVLSNRDTNRIVCAGGKIDGFRFSEEKGALVDASGSEAYIKFQIEQLGDSQKHVTVRSEFYFQCGGVTYTLLAMPRDMPAQTIHLTPGTTKAHTINQRRFGPLSDEERAVEITKLVLTDNIPSTFPVRFSDEPYVRTLLPKLDVRLAREVRVPGTGFKVREFRLRARTEAELAETLFLRPEFGSSIYAVTLERLSLKAGETGRAVLIYKGDAS